MYTCSGIACIWRITGNPSDYLAPFVPLGSWQARVNKTDLRDHFTRMEKLQSFVEEGPLAPAPDSAGRKEPMIVASTYSAYSLLHPQRGLSSPRTSQQRAPLDICSTVGSEKSEHARPPTPQNEKRGKASMSHPTCIFHLYGFYPLEIHMHICIYK